MNDKFYGLWALLPNRRSPPSPVGPDRGRGGGPAAGAALDDIQLKKPIPVSFSHYFPSIVGARDTHLTDSLRLSILSSEYILRWLFARIAAVVVPCIRRGTAAAEQPSKASPVAPHGLTEFNSNTTLPLPYRDHTGNLPNLDVSPLFPLFLFFSPSYVGASPRIRGVIGLREAFEKASEEFFPPAGGQF